MDPKGIFALPFEASNIGPMSIYEEFGRRAEYSLKYPCFCRSLIPEDALTAAIIKRHRLAAYVRDVFKVVKIYTSPRLLGTIALLLGILVFQRRRKTASRRV